MSRLMVVDRSKRTTEHRRFVDLVEHLRPGDLLVANRSRVIPARLRARRQSGGAVELLLLEHIEDTRWRVLARPSRKLRSGEELALDGSALHAQLEDRGHGGEWAATFFGTQDVAEELRRVGSLPLPPYIRDPAAPQDRYQTVYADRDGSIAAPTAGLHFTEDMLARIRASGVEVEFVTLHVGRGTFQPVSAESVSEHTMHAEWGEIPPATAHRLTAVRREGRRIVAVGTTTTRLVESASCDDGVRPFSGHTNLFIYPGYRFKSVGALVTNFHLPRSTLLMLISAFADRELILRAYSEAVERRYRFYSFGDAMLIV